MNEESQLTGHVLFLQKRGMGQRQPSPIPVTRQAAGQRRGGVPPSTDKGIGCGRTLVAPPHHPASPLFTDLGSGQRGELAVLFATTPHGALFSCPILTNENTR